MEVKYRDIAQDIARKAVDGSLDLDEFNALVEEQRRELIRKRDHLVVKDETCELIQRMTWAWNFDKAPCPFYQ